MALLVQRLVDITMSPQPLIDNISQRLGNVIAHPSHEIPVEFKVHAAVFHHEPANVLCIPVAFTNQRISCERVTVPIETHGQIPYAAL